MASTKQSACARIDASPGRAHYRLTAQPDPHAQTQGTSTLSAIAKQLTARSHAHDLVSVRAPSTVPIVSKWHLVPGLLGLGPLDEPAKTLKPGVHRVPGGENMFARRDGSVRYFTVRASARSHSFPDEFLFHGSWNETMRQLGKRSPQGLPTLSPRISPRHSA